MSHFFDRRTINQCWLTLLTVTYLGSVGCTSNSLRLPFYPLGSKKETQEPAWLDEKAGLANQEAGLESTASTAGPPATSSAESMNLNDRVASRVEPTRSAPQLRPTTQTEASSPRTLPGPDSALPTDSQVAPAIVTQAPRSEPAEPTTQLASATRANPIPPIQTLEHAEDLATILAETPGTVILDFYAEWCGPCKIQAKIFHSLQTVASRNQSTIVKIDVEKHPELQEQFRVTAMPTLVVFKDGKLIHRQTGRSEQDRERFESWLSE